MQKFLLTGLVFCLIGSYLKVFSQTNPEDVQGSWNGTVKFVQKYSGLTGHSERYIDLDIKENKVTGSHKYSSDALIGGQNLGHSECFGIGEGELHFLIIRTWDSTYDIHIINPECKGQNDGTSGTDIVLSEERLKITDGKLDVNDLSGDVATEGDVAGLGKVTTYVSWHLVRSLDVELIVTPIGYDKNGVQKSYDEWLPEPGKDEMTKGSIMKLKLKLQSKSGKPLKFTAQSFDLKLSNTSKEPGITINFPLSPQANQLPDLRFIPKGIAESYDDDQFITLTPVNGSTAEVDVGSYDGGGATTLTAEAILVGGIHVKGQLLVSGGEEQIQIPKRIPGTMIATAWRTANGNPEESEDKETSMGNNNNGDGLTAYEEYRGVISQGKFKRLDPQKKELGIKITETDFSVLGEGIKWFESASGLQIVRFEPSEIGEDRRLNKNYRSAHDYDQFVLYLKIGNLSLLHDLGRTYGVFDVFSEAPPDVPAKTEKIIIDVEGVKRNFQSWDAAEHLPFTVSEKIANVVAHEMGHGVAVSHHGDLPDDASPQIATENNNYRVFAANGFEISTRPYPLLDAIGITQITGGLQSGDLSCVMAYNPCYSWSHRIGPDARDYFFEVPTIKIGRSFCTSSKGTGINSEKFTSNNLPMSSNSTPITMYEFNKFFGDATKGNCLAQIRLR